MRLTIAYSKIKKRNLVLINNATYQKETLSERPIRQPLRYQKHAKIVKKKKGYMQFSCKIRHSVQGMY